MKHLKNLIAFSIISLISFSAKAQIPVRAFEFEASIGRSFPLSHYRGEENWGNIFGIEFRHNLKKIPMDIGFEINLTLLERDHSYFTPPNKIEPLTLRNTSLFLTTSYNFARGKAISPFIGFGFGLSDRAIVAPGIGFYGVDKRLGIGFSPRIGIEIYRHFRLTLDFRLTHKIYNAVCLRMGVIIGGGKK